MGNRESEERDAGAVALSLAVAFRLDVVGHPAPRFPIPYSRFPIPGYIKSNNELDCSFMNAFCAACSAVLSSWKRLIASA